MTDTATVTLVLEFGSLSSGFSAGVFLIGVGFAAAGIGYWWKVVYRDE